MRTWIISIAGMMLLASLLSGVGLTACSGDDDPPPAADPDAGMSFVCDPALATPQGALLNAPLDDSVQVIQKTPTHPGDPGPDGLP